jgi:uncharacterized protein (UPF0335 family)
MSINNNHLATIIDRIEALESDKAEISEGIREIYAEAKCHGFDPKIIRKVVAIRKKDKAKLEEEQVLIDIYLNALGQLADTPLGKAAIKREFD